MRRWGKRSETRFPGSRLEAGRDMGKGREGVAPGPKLCHALTTSRAVCKHSPCPLHRRPGREPRPSPVSQVRGWVEPPPQLPESHPLGMPGRSQLLLIQSWFPLPCGPAGKRRSFPECGVSWFMSPGTSHAPCLRVALGSWRLQPATAPLGGGDSEDTPWPHWGPGCVSQSLHRAALPAARLPPSTRGTWRRGTSPQTVGRQTPA